MSLIIAVGPLPPPIHGASAVNAAVCTELAAKYDVRVANTSVPGVARRTYHLKRLRRHLSAALTLWRHRRAEGARWVYVTSPGGAAVWYLVALVGFARACGFRIAVHHHSYAYLSRPRFSVKRLVSAVGVDGFHILLAPEMRKRFDQMYRPKQPSVVCSNVAWMRRGIPPSGTQRGDRISLRIGYLGSLSREKGLGDLRNLMQRLLADRIEAELWLAGAPTGDDDQSLLEQTLRDLGLSRGKWFGLLSGEQKEEFFNEIDVFVFPTRYRHEAQPMVVFEALQAGVPVVSYARGCIAGQLRRSGLLVPTVADFVEYARSYLSGLGGDPAMRDEARRLARRTFEDLCAEATRENESLISLFGTGPEASSQSFDPDGARFS